MDAGWHEKHRFTSYPEKNSHIAIIARSLLLDSDFISNKLPGLEPMYGIYPEALHFLMHDIIQCTDFRKYKKLADVRQCIDHLIGDNLGHRFINSHNGGLTNLVSEAIGTDANPEQGHLGWEKIAEQQVYRVDPGFPKRIMKALRKTKRHVRKLGHMMSDYLNQGDLHVEPRKISCGIMFAMGLAYRRMEKSCYDKDGNNLGPEYAHHFSIYQVEPRSPSIFDKIGMKLIMSSPRVAFAFGRIFDETDRKLRINAPPESPYYKMFESTCRIAGRAELSVSL